MDHIFPEHFLQMSLDSKEPKLFKVGSRSISNKEAIQLQAKETTTQFSFNTKNLKLVKKSYLSEANFGSHFKPEFKNQKLVGVSAYFTDGMDRIRLIFEMDSLISSINLIPPGIIKQNDSKMVKKFLNKLDIFFALDTLRLHFKVDSKMDFESTEWQNYGVLTSF